MKQISWSPLFTQIFDILWLGFASIWTIGAAVAAVTQQSLLAALFVAVGALFCALGYWSLRRDWQLADEVSDAGDVLVVKKGSNEARIAFSEIQAVEETTFVRRPRILLDLKQPNTLGTRISFIPKDSFSAAFSGGSSIADSIRGRAPHM